jgi:hypothetical protein
MITFTFIEDYLEVLAGFREISKAGCSPSQSIALFATAGPISLARYDVSIIHSMAESTILGKALTDRQSELAVRLVSKYQKQFAKLKVDVAPSVQNPAFRFPVRLVDRSKSAFIKDNQIIIKFPYNKELVQIFSNTAKESKGRFTFDFDVKEWHLAITESNVNWVSNLVNHGFTIDNEISALMQLILDCEKQEYKIELTKVNDKTFTITNAEPNLIQSVEDTIGKFEYSNLVKLVDFGAYGGYTISCPIQEELAATHSPLTLEFLLNKNCHFMRNALDSDGLDLINPLLEYANLTNRWPIYVFEPESGDYLRRTLNKVFKDDEIYELIDTKIKGQLDFSKFKCVYFKKLKQAQKMLSVKIPILVSTSAIENRQIWVLHAEKVIYYTATTYDQETVKIVSKINN